MGGQVSSSGTGMIGEAELEIMSKTKKISPKLAFFPTVFGEMEAGVLPSSINVLLSKNILYHSFPLM